MCINITISVLYELNNVNIDTVTALLQLKLCVYWSHYSLSTGNNILNYVVGMFLKHLITGCRETKNLEFHVIYSRGVRMVANNWWNQMIKRKYNLCCRQ